MNHSDASQSKSKWRWTITLIVLSTIIVLFALPSFLNPAPPTFCKECHQMKQYFESWKKSSHGKVGIDCEKCHVKPKFLSSILYKSNLYVRVYRYAFHPIKPFAISRASTVACRQCHSLNRVRSTSGDLKINHRIHVVKAKLACPTCHSGAVHPGVGKLGNMNPPRKQCAKCHRKKMRKCSYCHVIKGKFEKKENMQKDDIHNLNMFKQSLQVASIFGNEGN